MNQEQPVRRPTPEQLWTEYEQAAAYTDAKLRTYQRVSALADAKYIEYVHASWARDAAYEKWRNSQTDWPERADQPDIAADTADTADMAGLVQTTDLGV
jgi:hypothetical protein